MFSSDPFIIWQYDGRGQGGELNGKLFQFFSSLIHFYKKKNLIKIFRNFKCNILLGFLLNSHAIGGTSESTPCFSEMDIFFSFLLWHILAIKNKLAVLPLALAQ